jgi:hypothetical protein
MKHVHKLNAHDVTVHVVAMATVADAAGIVATERLGL